VREHERIAEMGVLRSAASIVHATSSPLGLPPVPEVAAAERPGLEAALRVLDERLGDGRPFVAGPRVTIADCTLAAALQFARFGKVDLPGGLERLGVSRRNRSCCSSAPLRSPMRAGPR
jgi:glutathione S-transferase